MQPYPMRRKDRALDDEETLAILAKGEYCVLATTGEDDQPYGVPLSYTYEDGKLYFHCAHKGRKLNNLRHNDRCCITVIGKTQPIYDKDFTTYYESVIAFGRAYEVKDEADKRAALMALILKYLPEHVDKADRDITRSLAATAIFCVELESITGKAKRSA